MELRNLAESRSAAWLEGWDPTPGIVSVWAEKDGRATVWRRIARTGELVREHERFRPWLLLDRLDDLRHLGARLGREGTPGRVSYRELAGPGALRYLVRADDARTLTSAVLQGAARRLGRHVGHVRELGKESVLALPLEEQYLVATGRTYFRDLSFDHVRRMQVDLETTGLDAERDRIFVVAVRDPAGATEILEARGEGDAGEAELIRRLVAKVQAADPDVIEDHNLHGFDLPFLDRRARRLGVPLALGRIGPPGLRQRAARRGVAIGPDDQRRGVRLVAPGRELIDTLDAVPERADRRDYDVDHYVRVLRDTFAARLERAFTPDDFAAVFADPDQPSLFPSSLATTRTVLTAMSPAGANGDVGSVRLQPDS